MSNSYHLWIVFVILAISNSAREHVAPFAAVAIICMTAIMLHDRQCRLAEHQLTVGQQLGAPRLSAREQDDEESAPVREEYDYEDEEDTRVEEVDEEELRRRWGNTEEREEAGWNRDNWYEVE